jgi:hypothetical protein
LSTRLVRQKNHVKVAVCIPNGRQQAATALKSDIEVKADEMDAQTRENWRRVKEHLERAGKTDNHYYKRALAILAGQSDPFDRFNFSTSQKDTKR